MSSSTDVVTPDLVHAVWERVRVLNENAGFGSVLVDSAAVEDAIRGAEPRAGDSEDLQWRERLIEIVASELHTACKGPGEQIVRVRSLVQDFDLGELQACKEHVVSGAALSEAVARVQKARERAAEVAALGVLIGELGG